MAEEIKQFVLKFKFFLVLSLSLYCVTENHNFLKDSEHQYKEFEIEDFNRVAVLTLEMQKADSTSRKVELILDTGANLSILRKDPEVDFEKSVKLELNTINSKISKEFGEVRVNLFDSSKKIHIKDAKFYSSELNQFLFKDGILGNDLLSNFTLFLEIPNRVYLISSPVHSSELEEFSKIPLRYDGSHLIVDVYISGKKYPFLLDTGAGISCIDKSVLIEQEHSENGNMNFFSVDGIINQTKLYRLNSICLNAKNCLDKMEFISRKLEKISYQDGTYLKGILGRNWFENYSVIIDYKNQRMFIKKR